MRQMLLVEDEELIRQIIAERFVICGFNVIEAATADEGAAILKATGDFVDILVTDIRTPGRLNGIDLGALAREGREWFPVVYVTGTASELLARNRLSSREALVRKPFPSTVLVAEVYRLLGDDCSREAYRAATPPQGAAG